MGGGLIGLGFGLAMGAGICAAHARRATNQSAATVPRRNAADAEAAAGAKSPGSSEAITLLAALQREARFVDFIQESLDGYSDAQIGAVARDVHRDCGAVLTRMFALRPAVGPRRKARRWRCPPASIPAVGV